MNEDSWSSRNARRDICEVGRRLYQLSFVAANDGNISVRMERDRVLCTPTGVSKGFLNEGMLAVCDMKGNQISGRLKISSEIRMHVELYAVRPDIGAIVHAHPPTATGYAVAGIELTACTLPEVIVSLGRVPLARYGTPGGPEIVEPIKPLLENHDAVLMANHGVVTVGKDVLDAHFKMETVEHFARIDLVARQLNSVKTLDPQQVSDLRDRFSVSYPTCDPDASNAADTRTAVPPAEIGARSKEAPDDSLVEEIAREVTSRLAGLPDGIPDNQESTDLGV